MIMSASQTPQATFAESQIQTPHAREGLEQQQEQHEINVGSTERMISGLAGAGLIVAGLSRRSLGGLAIAAVGGALVHRGITGHCYGYGALGVNTAERDGAEPEEYFARGIHVEQSFTINKPADELYRYWRQLENLPRIMPHLESVTVIDDKRSHWVAKGPAGMNVEWDAQIINDEPNELIAWRTIDGSTVNNAGSVRFVSAPGDRGTQVKVVIDYLPPMGHVGKWVAKLFGKDPEHEIREGLRAFKQIHELGEVPTIIGQPRGTCTGQGKVQETW